MAIVFDFQKFKNLKGRLDGQTKVKVGIIGSKATRVSEDGTPIQDTNAAIGYKHEFGTYSPELKKRLPVRSFLRMPLKEKFQKTLESKKFYKQEMEKILFVKSEDQEFFKKIGQTAIWVILEAFKTGGFGKWKPSVMAFKKNHQTLIETRQLMASISSKVEMKK